MSCDPTANGFQFTENYVLGPGGEELTMLDGNNNWQRTNVYAAGKLMGTYDLVSNPAYVYGGSQPAQIPALHFHLEDPLGSRRMQLSGNLPGSAPGCPIGQPETDIQSLPFGDQLNSYPDPYACATADDSTPLHFTGKERDTESGNDYFGARYYASTMGRWISPDEPFADQNPANPQSWNLYVYARNNPLRNIDTDGFKVLEAVLAQAQRQIAATVAAGGDTFTMVFLGIHSGADSTTGLAISTYTGDNIGQWSNEFGLGALDTSANGNTILLPNGNGDLQAALGATNQDQIDTANAIAPFVTAAGLSLDGLSHSNGVNDLGAVAAGGVKFDSTVAVAPNTSSTATMTNIVNASNRTTIVQSTNDSRLALTPAKRSPSFWARFFSKNKNVNVQQTDQKGHGAQCYAAEIHGQDSTAVTGCK